MELDDNVKYIDSFSQCDLENGRDNKIKCWENEVNKLEAKLDRYLMFSFLFHTCICLVFLSLTLLTVSLTREYD